MLPLEATDAIAETCLCLHVQTAGRAVARHADDVFRPLGLTNGQFAMLLTLHRAAPVTVGDLAKRLTMDPSTATADLKPLGRRGLVVSRSHATDGRVRLVALTAVRFARASASASTTSGTRSRSQVSAQPQNTASAFSP